MCKTCHSRAIVELCKTILKIEQNKVDFYLLNQTKMDGPYVSGIKKYMYSCILNSF